MKLKVGDDVKVLNHKLKKYIGAVGYICNIQYNKCFIGFYRYPDYIWNNLKSVKLYKFLDYEKAIPKTTHKRRK